MIFLVKNSKFLHSSSQLLFSLSRTMASKTGLVLGTFTIGEKDDNKQIRLTQLATKLNEECGGLLLKQINAIGPIDGGRTRVFYDVGRYSAVAVSGLGDPNPKYDPNEGLNQKKESTRLAAANGVRALIDLKVDAIEVDDLEDGQAAAEGAYLAAYKFQEFKDNEKRTKIPPVTLSPASTATADWERGKILADFQNFARLLEETPANLMTPTIFCQKVVEKAKGLNNLKIEVHDEDWARAKKMGSFLSVTNGTAEPAKFLEITYTGGNNKEPVCLVGKGITFDSGGISLKPSAKMDEMRADMGGAANVVGVTLSLAALKVPVNVKTFVPLCENLPGGRATKPGDVVTAMNGKTICVDNTDAEGRLVLADALCYAVTFNPK